MERIETRIQNNLKDAEESPEFLLWNYSANVKSESLNDCIKHFNYYPNKTINNNSIEMANRYEFILLFQYSIIIPAIL